MKNKFQGKPHVGKSAVVKKMAKKTNMKVVQLKMAKPPTVSALVVAQNLEKDAKPLINKLVTMEIKTLEQYQLAATRMSELKAIARAAEGEKEKFTKPLNELLKVTRNHFKPFFDRVDSTERAIKTAMIDFLNRQEEATRKLNASFAEGKIAKTSTLLRKTEELAVTSGDATVRKIKVVSITNLKKIPLEFLTPDMGKIKAALVAGEEVPGAELVEEKNIAI